QSLLAKVPEGTLLVIIPGHLAALPLQWALGGRFPLRYLPSFRVGVLLNHRHNELSGGMTAWRPKTVRDFVVWRAGEQHEVVGEFLRSSKELEKACIRLGVGFRAIQGVAASHDAMIESFASCECIRISCHGRARMSSAGPQFE